MWSDCSRLLVIGSAVLALAGCATGEEWNTWRDHPTHFASGTHMGFSVRNRDTGTPRVTRQDVAAARNEAWWGKAVTVGQEQILER
jgi:hypothetical protein